MDDRFEFVPNPDAVYTQGSLKTRLGLSDSQLEAALGSGLRHVRVGQRLLFRGCWLIEWLEREGSASMPVRKAVADEIEEKLRRAGGVYSEPLADVKHVWQQ